MVEFETKLSSENKPVKLYFAYNSTGFYDFEHRPSFIPKTTPGSAFTDLGEGYIRLSYASSMEELEIDLD